MTTQEERELFGAAWDQHVRAARAGDESSMETLIDWGKTHVEGFWLYEDKLAELQGDVRAAKEAMASFFVLGAEQLLELSVIFQDAHSAAQDTGRKEAGADSEGVLAVLKHLGFTFEIDGAELG